MISGDKMKNIRLIARLDVKGPNLVKGIQLEGLRRIGNPNAYAKKYYEQGIDEILYIDIVASLYNRNNLSEIVTQCTQDVLDVYKRQGYDFHYIRNLQRKRLLISGQNHRAFAGVNGYGQHSPEAAYSKM